MDPRDSIPPAELAARALRVAALEAEVNDLEQEVTVAEDKAFHGMDDVIGQRQWNRMSIGSGRQCIATSRNGERCRRPPTVGGFSCHFHGGASPGAKQAARQRLLAMVEPALDALLRMLQQRPPCPHCGRTDADRDPVVLRAAQVVLDRTGFHPSMTLEVAPKNPFEGLTEDELIDRLQRLLAAATRNRDLKRAQLRPGAPGDADSPRLLAVSASVQEPPADGVLVGNPPPAEVYRP